MTRYFSIRHNTARNRRFPEICKIVDGVIDSGPCPTCKSGRRKPDGTLRVLVARRQAALWPDVIACGDYPCLVVSNRFVAAMRSCGVVMYIGGDVVVVDADGSPCSIDLNPMYAWIDGAASVSAVMNFEASGFVDVRFCPSCRIRSNDISRTYDRQHVASHPGYVLTYNSAIGLDVFTSDLSPTAFFCTQRVVDCASQNKLTNIAFRPLEQAGVGEPISS